MKESSEGMNSGMVYLIYCKNLCKCYKVPTSCTTIKKFNATKKFFSKEFSCEFQENDFIILFLDALNSTLHRRII
jgi:hypothetical protein